MKSDQISNTNNNNKISDFQGNTLNPDNNLNGNSRISSFANICNTDTEIKDISPSSHNENNIIKSLIDNKLTDNMPLSCPIDSNITEETKNIYNFSEK